MLYPQNVFKDAIGEFLMNSGPARSIYLWVHVKTAPTPNDSKIHTRPSRCMDDPPSIFAASARRTYGESMVGARSDFSNFPAGGRLGAWDHRRLDLHRDEKLSATLNAAQMT